MPVIDEKRCVVNGVRVSVAEYLRVLANDIRYASDREQLLQWAAQYEQEEQS
jgi:hypothetical protein